LIVLGCSNDKSANITGPEPANGRAVAVEELARPHNPLLLEGARDGLAFSEGIFASRTVYSASSTDLVSPELFADYFFRTAWVSATSTVVIAHAAGDSFWVHLRGPDGFETSWLHVGSSYSWQPTVPGNWTVEFGQPGIWFGLIDFQSVTTSPRSKLVAALRDDVLAVSKSWPQRTERIVIALLRRAEHALRKGNDDVAREYLESFTRLIPSLLEENLIPVATGKLWTNVTEYVLGGT